jgi:hypothetical protein
MTETIDGTEAAIETATEEVTANAAVRDLPITARVAIMANRTHTLTAENIEPASAKTDMVVRVVAAEIAETEIGIATVVGVGAMMIEDREEEATCSKTEEEAPDAMIDEAAKTAMNSHNKLAREAVAVLLPRSANLHPT